jgi:hypothetical protein
MSTDRMVCPLEIDMSGRILPLVPKRLLDFSMIAVSSIEDVVLADRVDVPSWRQLNFRVNVYDRTCPGGSISIMVYPRTWTAEEPGLVFVDSTNAWSQLINDGTPSPGFMEGTIPTVGTACIGHMARIIARGNRAGAATLKATISVEFSMKDA